MSNGNKEDFFLLLNLMNNLSNISGQNITYNTDNKGKSILAGEGCKDDCKNPSESASNYIDHLINSSETIKVMNDSRNTTSSKGSGSHAYADGRIYLDANQIYSIQSSLDESSIGGQTMNTGFVFLHETLHTKTGASYYDSPLDNRQKEGGRFRDPDGAWGKGIHAGYTVERVNKFREEMGLPTRETYSNWDPNNPGSLVLRKNGNVKTVPIVIKQSIPESQIPKIKN